MCLIEEEGGGGGNGSSLHWSLGWAGSMRGEAASISPLLYVEKFNHQNDYKIMI